MSHKANDLWLEELGIAEQDLNDALESLYSAQKEKNEAIDWEEKCKQRVLEYQEVLEKIKNKE